jgi:hypothetical protein
MSQGHLDRLTSIDAGFLHQEDGGAHMHIGGLGVFGGPAPSGDAFRDHLASRLALVPRYRQRLVDMPFGTGRPLWADDPGFRHRLPRAPHRAAVAGQPRAAADPASRIMSQRLDRTKPLWEMWLVEGLEGGRWAIVSKTHHAMIDGVGGVDLMTALFDLGPDTTPVAPDGWTPATTPGARAAGLPARGPPWATRSASPSAASRSRSTRRRPCGRA